MQVNHHKLLFAGNYYKCFYLFMPTTVLKNTITVRILQRRKQRGGATVDPGLESPHFKPTYCTVIVPASLQA